MWNVLHSLKTHQGKMTKYLPSSCIVPLMIVMITAVAGLNILANKDCYLTDTRKGVCTSISKCKPALTALRQCNVRAEYCGWSPSERLICCPSKFIIKQMRPSDNMCTKIYYLKNNYFGVRIIGTAVKDYTQYPHMAALGYYTAQGQGPFWNCGGSLINEYFVLTAAHCLYNADGHKRISPRVVQLGSLDLLHPDDLQSQLHHVKKAIPHEHYDPTTYANDIAVLRLKTAVYFTKFVLPACLFSKNLDFKGEVLTALGWGLVANPIGTEGSQILREAKLRELNYDVCHSQFRNYVGEEEMLICAGGTGNATCRGDSGGPLQLQSGNGRDFHIVGITSVGTHRCSERPAYYTRITYYLEWIEKLAWKEEHCLYSLKLPQ